jgi:hypothetical protein
MLVLAVVDMAAVATPATVMARASGMTMPLMDGGTGVTGPSRAGRGARPDRRCCGENARND